MAEATCKGWVSAARFREQLGGISRQTQMRWKRLYSDFPEPTYVNGRPYYPETAGPEFMARRAFEQKVAA